MLGTIYNPPHQPRGDALRLAFGRMQGLNLPAVVRYLVIVEIMFNWRAFLSYSDFPHEDVQNYFEKRHW